MQYATTPDEVRAATDAAIADADGLVAAARGDRRVRVVRGGPAPVRRGRRTARRRLRRGGVPGQRPRRLGRPARRPGGRRAPEPSGGSTCPSAMTSRRSWPLRGGPAAAALTGERRRFLDHLLRDLRRAGHGLDPADPGRALAPRGRLVELESAFQRNIDEARDWLDLTRDELAGLSEAFVAASARARLPARSGSASTLPSSTRSWTRPTAATCAATSRVASSTRPGRSTGRSSRRRSRSGGGSPHCSATRRGLTTRSKSEWPASPMPSVASTTICAPGIEALAEAERSDLAGRASRGDRRNRPATVGCPLLRRLAQAAPPRHRPARGRRVLPARPRLEGPVRDHRRGLRAGLSRRAGRRRTWHPDVRRYEIRDRASGELLAYATRTCSRARASSATPRPSRSSSPGALPTALARYRCRRSWPTSARRPATGRRCSGTRRW